MARTVNVESMSNELAEIRHRYRGVWYVLRELPYRKYQQTIELATTDVDGVKTIDNEAHTKILMTRCLVEPKIEMDDLFDRGTRLIRQLQRNLQALHWDDEPEEDAAADDDEGEAAPGS